MSQVLWINLFWLSYHNKNDEFESDEDSLNNSTLSHIQKYCEYCMVYAYKCLLWMCILHFVISILWSCEVYSNLFYTIVNSLRYVQYLVFHNSHLVMSIFYIWIIYVHVISNIVRCLFVDRLRLVQYLMMSILNACGLYLYHVKYILDLVL